MKAVTYADYGAPSVLQTTDVDTPQPAADEVLIHVAATGVNPIDARLRSGELRWLLPGGFPRIPGYDVAGVVEDAGSDCPFQRGERVMAFLDHLYGGGYAEYATCSHTSIVRMPPGMPFEEAAALPLAGSTALQSLRDHGKLRRGQNVLVLGASGGVGAFAVQIAKSYGGIVTGVASGNHEDFVRSLGADRFINYEQCDYSRANHNWDLIFDVAGKSSFQVAQQVLSPKGNYVTTEPSLRGLVTALVTWPRAQHGTPMLARSRGDDLNELVQLYARQQLVITVAETYLLDRAAEAHRRIEQGGFRGKLVIRTPDLSARGPKLRIAEIEEHDKYSQTSEGSML